MAGERQNARLIIDELLSLPRSFPIVLGIVLKSWWGLLGIGAFLSAWSNYINFKTF